MIQKSNSTLKRGSLEKLMVEQDSCGLRVDKYLASKFLKISRMRIKHLIENGNLKINDITILEPKRIIKNADKLQLLLPLQEPSLPKINNPKPQIQLDIVYEDRYLLVINKPAKLLVHAGAGRANQETLADYLLDYCDGQLSKIGGDARPGIVHRLDMETSGLMIVAKDDITHALLSKMFEKHSIIRHYKGFCIRQPVPKIGKLNLSMRKSKRDKTRMAVCTNKEGKLSITNYKVLKSYMDGKFSQIEFQLQTGRTHQIRLHMEYKKIPIIGDKVYGKHLAFKLYENDELNEYIGKFPRHALHSYYMKFTHPITEEEMEFEIDLPKDLKELEGRISCE